MRYDIPERWLDYKPFNKTVFRFLPFKVPLKHEILAPLPEYQKFSWPRFLQELQGLNLKLGLVIDLCNTDRYYDKHELQQSQQPVIHYKLECRGHDDIPTAEVFEEFAAQVKQFLRSAGSDDLLIGVHCTHGVNRTGFLICKYLILFEGWDPAIAVDTFVQNRGHNFDKNFYVDHLLSLDPENRETPPRNMMQLDFNVKPYQDYGESQGYSSFASRRPYRYQESGFRDRGARGRGRYGRFDDQRSFGTRDGPDYIKRDRRFEQFSSHGKHYSNDSAQTEKSRNQEWLEHRGLGGRNDSYKRSENRGEPRSSRDYNEYPENRGVSRSSREEVHYSSRKRNNDEYDSHGIEFQRTNRIEQDRIPAKRTRNEDFERRSLHDSSRRYDDSYPSRKITRSPNGSSNRVFIKPHQTSPQRERKKATRSPDTRRDARHRSPVLDGYRRVDSPRDRTPEFKRESLLKLPDESFPYMRPKNLSPSPYDSRSFKSKNEYSQSSRPRDDDTRYSAGGSFASKSSNQRWQNFQINERNVRSLNQVSRPEYTKHVDMGNLQEYGFRERKSERKRSDERDYNGRQHKDFRDSRRTPRSFEKSKSKGRSREHSFGTRRGESYVASGDHSRKYKVSTSPLRSKVVAEDRISSSRSDDRAHSSSSVVYKREKTSSGIEFSFPTSTIDENTSRGPSHRVDRNTSSGFKDTRQSDYDRPPGSSRDMHRGLPRARRPIGFTRGSRFTSNRGFNSRARGVLPVHARVQGVANSNSSFSGRILTARGSIRMRGFASRGRAAPRAGGFRPRYRGPR